MKKRKKDSKGENGRKKMQYSFSPYTHLPFEKRKW